MNRSTAAYLGRLMMVSSRTNEIGFIRMSELLLLVSAIMMATAIFVGRKRHRPRRLMREGKLLKSEMVSLDGERFYVEKIAFKDWHVSLHYFYLILDRLSEGHTIVEQK